MATHPINYLTSRGLLDTPPEALNNALRVVLDSMESMVYGDATRGMTEQEQAVLREAGFKLERSAGADPLAETAVKYAAVVKRSLTTEAVSEKLGLSSSRVRQMISDRSLYSFLIERHRYVPDFQFIDGELVPNIAQVNRALSTDMHPVEVYNWYHLPNVDLFVDDDIDQTVSPLEWLKAGRDVERVVFLANRL